MKRYLERKIIWFSLVPLCLGWLSLAMNGQTVYPIGGEVSAPLPTYRPDPNYSEKARNAKAQGTVVLQLEVDKNGLPRNLKIIRPLGLGLDQKAIECVRKWRFRPGMKNGEAVATAATVEVNFRLVGARPADGNALNLGEASVADLSAVRMVGKLSDWKDLPSGSGTILASGSGTHSYSATKLDLSQFPYGGTLVLEITTGHKHIEASFDLFSDGTSLQFAGEPTEHGSVSHVWDVVGDDTVSLIHRFERGAVFVLGAEASSNAREGDSNDFHYTARVYENLDSLAKRGEAMSSSEAAQLEQKVLASPQDLGSRAALVAYYSTHPGADPKSARAARSSHILWMIKDHPDAPVFDKASLWSFNRMGDPLADEEAYSQGKSLWLDQVKLRPQDTQTLRRAAQYMMINDPEEAEGLVLRLIEKNRGFLAFLGGIYGRAILGVTAQDYLTGGASMCSADKAQSDFAKRALAMLDASSEPALISAAGKTIAKQGEKLYSSGKLSWDYGLISKRLLAKVPEHLQVDPNIEAAKLIHKVTPRYPRDAAAARIQGVVTFQVIIGRDGHVQNIQLVSGHPALVPAAEEAVRQWVYKPTLLDGEPVEVVTTVYVTFKFL